MPQIPSFLRRDSFLPKLILSLSVAAVLIDDAQALVSLRAGWATYKTLLTEKPILTKSLTSGAIMGISDAVTQRLERRFLLLEQPKDGGSAD